MWSCTLEKSPECVLYTPHNTDCCAAVQAAHSGGAPAGGTRRWRGCGGGVPLACFMCCTAPLCVPLSVCLPACLPVCLSHQPFQAPLLCATTVPHCSTMQHVQVKHLLKILTARQLSQPSQILFGAPGMCDDCPCAFHAPVHVMQ
jgi:hypothetical protein